MVRPAGCSPVAMMASSLGVGRTTLREYLSRARDAGLSWPLPSELTYSDLEHLLFPRRPAGNSDPIPLPNWAYVHAELRRNSRVVSVSYNGDQFGQTLICRAIGRAKRIRLGGRIARYAKPGFQRVAMR